VPHLIMIASLAEPELPAPMKVVNPAGAGGAVTGMAGPANEEPNEENMAGPLREGEYVAIGPGGGTCSLAVERSDPDSEALSLEPAMLEASGLTEATLAKFNQPAWRVIIQMLSPGEDIVATVQFATQLARRLAALGDGIVMDTSAYRFFGPDGWAVEDPIAGFDIREHVHLHIEPEAGWFHTHGLVKFGRPELEIYAVPAELEAAAFRTLLDVSQYVCTTALIQPGETCGDPGQPFFAREGSRNRDGHWNDLSVLELVDVAEDGKPVASGAPMALRLAALPAGDDPA